MLPTHRYRDEPPGVISGEDLVGKSASRRRLSIGSSRRFKIPLFLRRLVRYPQMDFELAFWQMLYLCIAPRRVYRNIYYHKQTKNQWARDDPAFVVLLSAILIVAAIAFGIAYERGIIGILRLILFMIGIDFIIIGSLAATLIWWFSNKFLITNSVHGVEQRVEWAYAFDIHCNAFFPLCLILYILQFCFMPLVTREGFLAAFIGNFMYWFAVSYYNYLIFLGLDALPFLQHTTIVLSPMILWAGIYIMSIFTVNLSKLVLNLYFG